MSIWSFLRSRKTAPPQSAPDSASGLKLSPYVGEYLAAIDRTEAFGIETPSRVLVKKDCLDMLGLRPVLLDFFDLSPPDSMIGQTFFVWPGGRCRIDEQLIQLFKSADSICGRFRLHLRGSGVFAVRTPQRDRSARTEIPEGESGPRICYARLPRRAGRA